MITGGVCTSYLLECQKGIHTDTDDYRFALYDNSASLTPDTTTAYTTTGEVTGTGYTAGGQSLSGFSLHIESRTVVTDFNDPSWPNSSITATGGLIYNASKVNRAVVVIDFGGTYQSNNGPFVYIMPAPDKDNAIITITGA